MERGNTNLVTMIAALVLLAAVASQLPAASAQFSYCGLSITELAACQPAAAPGDNPPLPSTVCCNAIKRADLNCLCKLAAKPDLFKSFNIDKGNAMKLPAACGDTRSVPCRV